jgi:hypothetical protein
MYVQYKRNIESNNKFIVTLIVTKFILPALAIMYASGSPENSDTSDSSDSGSTDTSNDGSSLSGGSNDSTVSNITGNAQGVES